jgi:CRISPR/Cas system-associated endonuclease Cas1
MHQPKDLRTLLVLDMMEMFRAWVVDDLVLKVLRKNIIEKDDFIIDKHSQTPVLLTDDGLKKFIDAYYKEVFKKSEYDNVLDGTKWVKLKYLEKTLEEFKKSLVDGEFEYK